MICTVTLNPSIDYVVSLDNLALGEVNRVRTEDMLPGGKGINVSVVLKNLGHPSRALGFVAGFTGAEVERMLADRGVDCDFVRLDHGRTRVNVKVHAREESEINGIGPAVGQEDLASLLQRLDGLGEGDFLVLAGSVPATVPHDVYQRMLARVAGRGVRTVVDAERDLLLDALPYGPFLIKPNNHELGAIFGQEVHTADQAVPLARRLQERGAKNVLVSMAGEGAVLVSEKGEVLRSAAPRGSVVNSVGAGDSMVAGFLCGYIEGEGDLSRALRMGICTGSATAFKVDLATRAEAEALMAQLG
ncbi:MAG: 1-phosphofructokinase [Olsenella sp.]|jgi:1-phosphofructokinase|nr:1-phosphofructokinase [Olsenella sp.]MCI1288873.1 1-phosphofructokinase [Olsenella sp.]